MKRYFFMTLLIILGSTMTYAGGIPGDVNNDNRIDLEDVIYTLQVSAGVRPPATKITSIGYHLGDNWTYKVGSSTENKFVAPAYENINGINTFKIYVGDGYSCRTSDANGELLYKMVAPDFSISFPTPVMLSPNSVSIGDYFTPSAQGVYIYQGISYPINIYWMIGLLGLETITVPAGSFGDSIKSAQSIMMTITDGTQKITTGSQIIQWAARGVGTIRSSETTAYGNLIIKELISATVNGKTYSGGGVYTRQPTSFNTSIDESLPNGHLLNLQKAMRLFNDQLLK
jgi:hypothetical protein